MSRRIDFRCWDGIRMTTNGIMFNNSTGRLECPIDSAILQRTGLLDKNGSEIWEGDYFQVANNKIYTVKWMDTGDSQHETYAATFVLWVNDELFFPFDEFALRTGEVVGNIYENLKTE